ncbi:hypothetical protein CIW83_05625 [Tissierella sp. P1]|jgi:transposase|uniref:transposase n=1 Tax=unclassified Tissierella TaxID=2638726 RepID=UPI000BA0FD02|nr:transposase [Tissierella sp. P1]OZV13022.1 hypothetical protein CIW83_05625 [Tissierella sp. P1]
MSRKKYSKEFKVQVVKQVIEEGKKTSRIAKELDLSRDMMYRWINEAITKFCYTRGS